LSHYLQTENPSAAAALHGEVQPLPGVGDRVLYRPRRSEVRRGRTVMPAIVLWPNEDSRTLELFVIADANDQINQEKVPESPCEGEWGWVRREASADALEREALGQLRADLDALREQIWGDNEPAEGNLAEAVTELEKRLVKAEKQVAKHPRARRARGKNKPKAVATPPVADAA
jgi:hypothetical protein